MRDVACGKLRFTPGFLFLAALLFYRGTPPFLTTFFLAAALHECAHILTARLMRVSVRSLSFTAFGCVLRLADQTILPGRTLFLVAAAGPAVNLVVALLCHILSGLWYQLNLFGAENLLLALFNLLPVFPLDGAILLSVRLSHKMPNGQGERTVCILTLLLAAAGALTALHMSGRARLRILLFAGWMAAGALQKLDLSIFRLSGKIKKSVK